MQICPLFAKAERKTFCAVSSIETSGIMMAASLPPSSRVRRFRLDAAAAMTRFPVAVEPVKLILSKPGCAVISGPNASPPVMMLSTPAGTKSRTSSPTRSTVIGVNGEGFSTMVLPASRAGAILKAESATGKFQGEIAATTPIGT